MLLVSGQRSLDQNKPWDPAKKEGMEERLHDVCSGYRSSSAR
jgi:hypothetical protein